MAKYLLPERNQGQGTRWYILLLLAGILGFSSCKSYEKLTYLRNIPEVTDSLFQKNKKPYYLQPADILYVRVITDNQEINDLFNPTMTGAGSNSMRGEGMYYIGYSVNDSGYIDLPVLKEVQVAGLSVEEAKEKIHGRALEYLKNPQVILKMAHFKFTVLGEVKSPGLKMLENDQVNMLEAIASAGDITYNGNRENVLLIRPVNGGTKTFRMDLTDKDLINSPYYYIHPNDIIYVEPLKSALFRERTSDYTFLITTLSSTLSLVTLIITLNSNLNPNP